MLNRGFGTSLFNMVPKGSQAANCAIIGFVNNLFNMIPKG